MKQKIESASDGSRILHTAQGIRVGFREFGDPNGEVLIFFHGWPASSSQGSTLHEAALGNGLRVISVDRPGFGKSSRMPGRHFLDMPPLIDELLETLEASRSHVCGLSGGGPYALACAWALPHRFRTALIISGAPPIDSPEALRKFSPVYRSMLRVRKAAPWLMKKLLVPAPILGHAPPPWPIMKQLLRLLPKRDREALEDRARFKQVYPSFANAMKSGATALFEDGDCYARPWGFDVSEISIPVRIWHGTQDMNFSHDLAQKLAARIPNATFFSRDEGHYSMPAFCIREMLDDLAAASTSQIVAGSPP